MARIRVFIDGKTGNSKIVGVSGAGDQCLEVTKNFEARLGVADESTRQLTEEFYENSIDNQIEGELGNG